MLLSGLVFFINKSERQFRGWLSW